MSMQTEARNVLTEDFVSFPNLINFFVYLQSTLHYVSYVYSIWCGRVRMVVGFTTSYAINAYHH